MLPDWPAGVLSLSGGIGFDYIFNLSLILNMTDEKKRYKHKNRESRIHIEKGVKHEVAGSSSGHWTCSCDLVIRSEDHKNKSSPLPWDDLEWLRAFTDLI